ncbi:Flavodoxin [Lachnospiraceae bacterium TWA4]|nr:Flavodoxin [Lachnospiraceae bacterium TWA4]
MTKKRIISLVLGAVMAVGLLSGCVAGSSSKSAKTEEQKTEASTAVQQTEESTESKKDTNESGKTLVVYYSAQGHTVNFAEAIAEELNADTFEITPVDTYSSEDLDWTKDGSRVNKEHDDESLRDIALEATTVENWDSYDTVYIGYPIWWGIAAWPVDNFVKDNDFTGKTVIPFATSSSSGMGESGEILEGYAGGGNWLEGKRFQSNEDVANAREWAASLAQ